MLARSAFKPRRRNAPRPAEKVAHGYLKWLRGRECACVTLGGGKWDCEGKIEAAHVDHAGLKGIGTKVADKDAIPLCSKHHRRQHNIGWRSFELENHFYGPDIAAEYWRKWPGRIAWEAKNNV